MRRIWSWLDNSIVALLITFPFSLGVVLADNISPWFLMLSALSALLWIPYVTGVAQ